MSSDVDEDLRRKSQLLWGVALPALLFLLETWNADRVMPNRASPYVWTFLGAVAVAAVAGALHFGRQARRRTDGQPQQQPNSP